MISKDWLRRSCPVCSSFSISKKPVGRAHTPAETLTFDEVKNSFVGLRKDQIFFSYYRCLVCHLLYAPYYFNKDQLDELYREMPDNLMGEDKATISKTQAGYVNWVKFRIKDVKRFLELGPDIGLVGKEVVHLFAPDSAFMIEPNLAVYAELKKSLFPTKDIHIYRDLQELPKEMEVDMVAGIHVYDHLLDPVGDLKTIRNASMKSAHLLIVVHNENSMLRKMMGSKWPPFCLQHPQLFNPMTLEHLLLNAGWKIREVSKSVNWWHLNHFAKMGSDVVGIPSAWTRFLPKFQFPVKLGNIIALASKSE